MAQLCVPKHLSLNGQYYKALEEFVLSAKQLLVLTGAGLSTESGTLKILCVNILLCNYVYLVYSYTPETSYLISVLDTDFQFKGKI